MSLAKVIAIGVFAAATFAVPAQAQEKYPSRPIEFVVPWGPGGGADQVARKAAKLMEPTLNVSLPVINVAGATGVTGLTKMLTSQSDGYTISIMTGDTFGLLATTQPKWSLDDFVPVAIMIKQPSSFLVAEGGKFKTWADVEKEAKVNPLKVAITGFGSPDEMTINYFIKKGLKFVGVPFPRPGERYSAILGGHAELLYEQVGDVRSFVDSKQMRPVIIFDDKRMDAFKDVPSSVELGHQVTLPQFRMVIVKAGTEQAKVNVLAAALEKVAKDPEYKAYLEEQYADPNSYVPSSDAQRFLKGELASMKALAGTK